jgi:hypothetical protein
MLFLYAKDKVDHIKDSQIEYFFVDNTKDLIFITGHRRKFWRWVYKKFVKV